MKIKISFADLPEAQDWEDGETYQIPVTQVSHSDEGATFEVVDESESGMTDIQDESEPSGNQGRYDRVLE